MGTFNVNVLKVVFQTICLTHLDRIFFMFIESDELFYNNYTNVNGQEERRKFANTDVSVNYASPV